jgi:hypothetical protein
MNFLQGYQGKTIYYFSGIEMIQNSKLIMILIGVLVTVILGTGYILLSITLMEHENTNVPPTAPVVIITPTPAYDNDTLICSIILPSTDPDNDSISYIFSWVLNGSLTDIITNDVPSIETKPGDVWQCFVTPFDGIDSGEIGSDTVIIQERLPTEPINTPPTAPEVSIVPDPVYTNMSLICNIITPSTDVDNDTITYFYEWFLNGSTTEFTGATLSSIYTHPNDIWICVVTPFDGQDYGPSGIDNIKIQDEDIPTPENTAPTAPVVFISPDPAYSNNTLTCTIVVPSNDTENDTISYFYEWFLNGSTTGFTGATLTSIHTHANDEWTCVVTPFDGQDYGLSGSDVSVIQDDGIPTPENTPPTAPVVIISPDPAYNNNTLTCTIVVPSNDTDNDTISYIYEWFLNENLTNITGPTVLPNRTSIMDQWKCVVTPFDSIAYGSSGNDTVLIRVDVSGTYSLSPIISYSCMWDIYSIFYSSFTFVDTGTTLTIQPLMNDGGYMTGNSASNGIIDVTFTYPGTCTDTYTLVGTFIDEDTWQATFTVWFTGMCYDCYSQQWTLTGTRV